MKTVLLLQAGEAASRWTLIDFLEYGGITLAMAFIISLLIRPKRAMKSWHHHFAGLQFASRDLYQNIINEVKERNVPNVSMSYGKFFEAGIFTPRREYLCIEYKKFSMDVCCISFGTGYYISWWLGQDDPGFWSRVPVVNNLLGLNPEHQSYYQLDTATLFQSGIHDAILAVIDEITEEKGLRKLTELERQAAFHKR